MRTLAYFVVGCCAILTGCIQPAPEPNPAAVLEGTWDITPEDTTGLEGITVVAVFSSDGQLTQFQATRASDGATATVDTTDSTVTVDGNQVTIEVPDATGTRTFTGTLSDDENTLTGSLSREINLGDLSVVFPSGSLTFERQVQDPCEGITCDTGETCVDGVCVANDPCEGITCDTGETCVDGVCVANDPCEGITCDTGETCVDGVCVANDPCEGITCDTGLVCVDGECVTEDPCASVTCDACESCVEGVCQPLTGNVETGQAFYTDHGCSACHGPNANDGFAPSLVGAACTDVLSKLDGSVSHGGGTVTGVTDQNAADLSAWLGSL